MLQQVADAHNRQLAIQEGNPGLIPAHDERMRQAWQRMQDHMAENVARHEQLRAQLRAQMGQLAQIDAAQLMLVAPGAQAALQVQGDARLGFDNLIRLGVRNPVEPPPRQRQPTEAIDLTGEDNQAAPRRRVAQLRPAGTDARRRRQDTIDLTGDEEG